MTNAADDPASRPLRIVAADPRAVACAGCGVPAHRETSICGSCGKSVAEGGPPSYFALLGLPEVYRVDAEVLEGAFHRVSRLVHPDRFGASPALERRLAVQRSTLLNDAYRTLRDPVKRAVYLLQRAGAQMGEETGTHDPELLTEVMEGRERVDELRDAAQRGSALAQEDWRTLCAEVDGKLRTLYEALDALFARYDAGESQGEVLSKLRAALERLRYFAGMRAQLEQIGLSLGPSV